MPATPGSLSRLRGALMLTAETVDHLSVRVHEFHRAISDIPFATLGAVPTVNRGRDATRRVHDGITDGVYGVIRSSARAIFALADQTLRRFESSSLPALASLPAPSDSSRRVQDDVVSALSGLVGDHMATRRNPLAIRMGVYRDGRRVRARADTLRDAYPDATPRLAVFLHGLCSSENAWSMFREPGYAESDPYGERLARDLGYTPVYLRYNSGLHISINGRSCSRVLEALSAHWPVPPREIVLIGHSMGGLVARAAADVAAARGAAWVSHLQQVVCLGSPHLGAPLEQVVHLGTHLMKRLPLSRPVARLLDSRSLGIKDLRWGYTQDAEWKGRDPDAFWTQDRLQSGAVPFVRYRFVGTCLTRDPQHPVARAIGDGLVRLPSSLATDIAGADGAMRAQLGHLRLLNHPEVYALLRDWLSATDSNDAPSPRQGG